jgi:ATPase subunit of ABC transporter with duplicated ATPase domains
LLLLDEPTNHLDLASVEWLENYLQSWPGAIIVVAHDRYFLDKVATRVWEILFGEIEAYRGNFSHYVQQRQERFERRQKEYEAQREFIAKEEEFIRRNLAGQRTREAQGRRTRLERGEARLPAQHKVSNWPGKPPALRRPGVGDPRFDRRRPRRRAALCLSRPGNPAGSASRFAGAEWGR